MASIFFREDYPIFSNAYFLSTAPTAKLEMMAPSSEEENNTVTTSRRSQTMEPSIPIGSIVKLKSADIIDPRLRFFANTDAVVTEVPHHPNTWYRVQLSSGQEVKLRRSSFDLCSVGPVCLPCPTFQHNGIFTINGLSVPMSSQQMQPSNEQVHQSFTSYHVVSPHDNSAPLNATTPTKPIAATGVSQVPVESLSAIEVTPTRTSSKPTVPKPLSSSDAPINEEKKPHKPHNRNLIGQHVVVCSGRNKGQVGLVVRGGNGYYSVALGDANDETRMVLKRSGHLRLLSEALTSEAAASTSTRTEGASWNDSKEPVVKTEAEVTRAPSKHRTDAWIGRHVRVLSGKNKGEVGVISRSGHGFHCVKLNKGGQTMKRAADLEEIPTSEIDESKMMSKSESSDEEFALKEAAYILIKLMNDNRKDIHVEISPFHMSKRKSGTTDDDNFNEMVAKRRRRDSLDGYVSEDTHNTSTSACSTPKHSLEHDDE